MFCKGESVLYNTRLCKYQYFPELINKNTFGFTPTKIGKWWDGKDTEIDIVATDNSNNIIFGKCKYTKKPLDVNVYYDLLEKVKMQIEISKTEMNILYSFASTATRTKCKTLQKKIQISFCTEINTSLVKQH